MTGSRSHARAAAACLPAAFALLGYGCGPAEPAATPPRPPAPIAAHAPGGGPGGEDRAYAATIEALRRERDDWFRLDPQSPVPPSARPGFPALSYYPVDPAWRMRLPVIVDREPRSITIVTNKGEERRIATYGRVEFDAGGKKVSLLLYRTPEAPGMLWVPFADASAGRETYPAGRYLEAELLEDGTVVLDFNRAYNPYCAYGLDFSCPIAPRENRLPVAIPAGERGFRH